MKYFRAYLHMEAGDTMSVTELDDSDGVITVGLYGPMGFSLFFENRAEAIRSLTETLALLEGNGDDSELDPAAEACREVAREPKQETHGYDCFTNVNCGRDYCVAHGGHGADS